MKPELIIILGIIILAIGIIGLPGAWVYGIYCWAHGDIFQMALWKTCIMLFYAIPITGFGYSLFWYGIGKGNLEKEEKEKKDGT